MKKSLLHSCVSLAAITSMAAFVSPAFAQDAAAPAADSESASTTGLDEIVVTASGRDKTKLKSSISVSSVSNEQIQNFTPRSEAEVLRTIPGLNLQDTAGPGGNSNIGVRGLPVSTGGSEYVGLQEDGLPVVLFGDIQFGNNDYWVRFDNSVERVEAVRGGSASTFSSQAPGAVINYISKTGEKEGGSVGISAGVNFRETRLDFNYGGPISDTLRFHVGGFVKNGNGVNHIGYTAEKGYQIKANITKEFADGKGFFRLNFKRLDDQEPTNTSQPSAVTVSNGVITRFSTFGNVDARKYSSAGIYNQNFTILDAQGNFQNVENQGIHPKTTSFGGEFHYEFSDNFSVDNNFRWTDASGVFANQWTGENVRASSSVACSLTAAGATAAGGTAKAGDSAACPAATNIANFNYAYNGFVSNPTLAGPGTGVGSLVYAAGPNQGQVYTGTYVSNSAQAYTTMKDVGSLANNLSIKGKFELGEAATLNVNAGWFHMRQTIAMDWRINNYTATLDSSGNSVPLDAFSGPNGTGTLLSSNGQTGYNNQWGGCCGGRVYNLDYTDDAPYMNVGANFGGLDLDASIRFDSVKASGYSYAPVAGANVTRTDALGTASLPTFNTDFSKKADILNYRVNYTSWSIGALYELADNTSLFARVSRGGRFNADRLLYGGGSTANYTASGALTPGGRAKSVNFVTQQEVGLKHRGNMAGGSYNVEATLYRAQVGENNYDFTKAIAYNTTYHSYGVETYGNFRTGGFGLDGSLVYTHSVDAKTGLTPHTMPKFTYRLSPSYDAGVAAAGFSLTGQSSSFAGDDDTLKIPGYSIVSAFAKVRPFDGLEIGLNASNLFNKLAYAGSGGLAANGQLFDNSAITGRTFSASVRYSF